MNYKSFNLGDWIGHISGVIEDETTLDGNEMRDLVEFLSGLQKTGHWVNVKVGKLFPSNDFKCSECGNILDFDGVNCGRGDANYCPNCGAKMVGDKDGNSCGRN